MVVSILGRVEEDEGYFTTLYCMREFTSGSGRKAAHTSSALHLKIVEGRKKKNQWCLLHTEEAKAEFSCKNAAESKMMMDVTDQIFCDQELLTARRVCVCWGGYGKEVQGSVCVSVPCIQE